MVLLVLGGVLAWAIEPGGPRSPGIVTAASNQRAAARDDHLPLGRLVLPADARSSPREPAGGSTLASEGPHTTNPDVIDQHAWWVVPRPELAVLAQASEEASGEGPCEPMHLWIHKQKQTPLAGGYSVIQEAEKLLHVTLH